MKTIRHTMFLLFSSNNNGNNINNNRDKGKVWRKFPFTGDFSFLNHNFYFCFVLFSLFFLFLLNEMVFVLCSCRGSIRCYCFLLIIIYHVQERQEERSVPFGFYGFSFCFVWLNSVICIPVLFAFFFCYFSRPMLTLRGTNVNTKSKPSDIHIQSVANELCIEITEEISSLKDPNKEWNWN